MNYVPSQADITLNGSIIAGDTSISVTVPTIQAGFGIVNPSGAGIYKVVMENEIGHFTSGAVTAGTQTWTLARGQEGTTAASHASGTVVAIEQTKGAIDNDVQLSPTAQQTGDINISGTVTAGTALSGPLAGSNLTGSVAIARLPTETNSADTSASHLVTADDTRLSNTRTPTAHASTHDVGGSDVLKDLTRLSGGPPANGYIAWANDIFFPATVATPTAGVVFLAKIMTAHAYTINNIDFTVNTAGTGATPLANCFVGIYDSGGTRRYLSADQSTPWATAGSKSIGSVAYTVTANDSIYIAFLVGTQSTTNMRFLCVTLGSNLGASQGLTNSAYRFGQQLTGQTTLPSSLTLSSTAITGVQVWAAVK